MKIAIIDYTAGNIVSIQNMLKRIGITSSISSDPKIIGEAEKLILPGVGSFDYGIQKLNELGLNEAIKLRVSEGTPILGICLGAQMMGKSSEEGTMTGLGLIDMDVVRFNCNELPVGYKIPHMGWNDIKIKKKHLLFSEMFEDPRFYFVHSYHFKVNNPDDVLTTSIYGYEFASSFQKDNMMGVQFHPEKSHKYGMQLLRKFVEL